MLSTLLIFTDQTFSSPRCWASSPPCWPRSSQRPRLVCASHHRWWVRPPGRACPRPCPDTARCCCAWVRPRGPGSTSGSCSCCCTPPSAPWRGPPRARCGRSWPDGWSDGNIVSLSLTLHLTHLSTHVLVPELPELADCEVLGGAQEGVTRILPEIIGSQLVGLKLMQPSHLLNLVV